MHLRPSDKRSAIPCQYKKWACMNCITIRLELGERKPVVSVCNMEYIHPRLTLALFIKAWHESAPELYVRSRIFHSTVQTMVMLLDFIRATAKKTSTLILVDTNKLCCIQEANWHFGLFCEIVSGPFLWFADLLTLALGFFSHLTQTVVGVMLLFTVISL